MAKRNSIIRKLPAVETLGSSTVICSDKTGTLTQNKMQVVQTKDVNGNKSNLILKLGTMCTDCTLLNKDGNVVVNGEPTEKAIVNAALEVGENKDVLYKEMERINGIPFDSTRKLMSTIHKVGNKYRIITKGAPDVLIKRCSEYYENGNRQGSTLWVSKKERVIKLNEEMAAKALRVMGVAYKDLDYLPSKIDESLEQGLVFVGLIGMIDPPREGVKEAVSTCCKAGIKTVMITGDHIITAKAIAKDLGILKVGDVAITGEELDRIPEKEFEKEINKYSVFARVSPEHKVKIVKSFRKTGNIVAMTGDGVNDAPALKSADIGVAMGITRNRCCKKCIRYDFNR